MIPCRSQPIQPKERACAEAWQTGGREAERAMRERWNQEERDRQLRSVKYLWDIREQAAQRAREAGLSADGDDEVEDEVTVTEDDENLERSEAALVGSTVQRQQEDEDGDKVNSAASSAAASARASSGDAAFFDQEASAPHSSNIDLPGGSRWQMSGARVQEVPASTASDSVPPPLEDMTADLAAASLATSAAAAADMPFISGPRAPRDIFGETEAEDLVQEETMATIETSGARQSDSLPTLFGGSSRPATTGRSMLIEEINAPQQAAAEEDEEEEVPEEIAQNSAGGGWVSLGQQQRPAAAAKPFIQVLSSTDVEALD